jgi:ABC-type sugar transport system permease subunit
VWTTLIFDIVFTMTGGGPVNATKILPIDIYETTFRSFRLGAASAKSAVTVVLLVLVTIVYWKFSDIEE